MKRISFWARDHAVLTRMFIICLYLPLNLLGLITGDLLNDLGFSFPQWFMLSTCLLVIVIVFFYPDKPLTAKSRDAIYKRRKACDFLLALSTFLMICYTGNQWTASQNSYAVVPASALPVAIASNTNISSVTAVKVEPGKKKIKKGLFKKIRNFIQEFRKWYKSKSDSEKVLLIILSIIIALGLILLLTALACSIACGGSGALAIIVYLLGLAGIIFLLIRIIRRITKGPRKKKVEDDTISTNT